MIYRIFQRHVYIVCVMQMLEHSIQSRLFVFQSGRYIFFFMLLCDNKTSNYKQFKVTMNKTNIWLVEKSYVSTKTDKILWIYIEWKSWMNNKIWIN